VVRLTRYVALQKAKKGSNFATPQRNPLEVFTGVESNLISGTLPPFG
jgi:hypothetical protein